MILQCEPKRFALQIIRLFSALPKTTKVQVIGKQVLRSGTSVGANYCEAYAAAPKLNGANGTSDMHGNAVRVAGVSRGGERMNLSRNAAIVCESLKNGACLEAAT